MEQLELADFVFVENESYPDESLPPVLASARREVSNLGQAFRERRNQRRAAHAVPPILYHYTNVAGLEGMLRNLSMWLSDAQFMNDPLEGSWVHFRASELAASILGESPLSEFVIEQVTAHLDAPDLWDEKLRGDEHEKLRWAAMDNAFTPAFIASFTENGDLLSQWRGYGAGGEGVSIGFDLTKLELSKIDSVFEPISPTLVKVEYDQSVHDTEISWIIKELKRVYDAYADVLSVNTDCLIYFTRLFYQPLRDALNGWRWDFKSPHYGEEQEWRLVARPFGVDRKKTRVSGGHIVPYLEMPLPQSPSRPLNRIHIMEIILGPRCQPALISGIRHLLTNLADPDIVRSKLALR